MQVQYYVKHTYRPEFTAEALPQLLYVARIDPADCAYSWVLHSHPDLVEVLLICEGSSEFLIGDRVQAIHPGDLVIYNSNVVHDEVVDPEHALTYYCAAIGNLQLPGLRRNALTPDDAPAVYPVGESLEPTRTLYDLMYRALSAGRPGSEEYCHHLMMALLAKVRSVTGSLPVHPQEGTEPNVLGRRIQEYIDEHFQEQISLPELGEKLHMSPYYLSHVFKQMIGYSPVQYLLRRRIGEAQKLLISTDLPVSRISEMVGYDTQSYFNLQFTKHVGMSPLRFRHEYVPPTDAPERPEADASPRP
jgi:AraC-like DNA-binding protein